MLQAIFHAWERHLSSITQGRIVRPFEWGLDWIPSDGAEAGAAPEDVVGRWVSRVMTDTDAFFTPEPTDDYRVGATTAEGERILTFLSALSTPHHENNTVRCRLFPARLKNGRSEHAHLEPRRSSSVPTPQPGPAVIVLPQWNASPDGHVGLCRLLAKNGMTALRLSLPYHDGRMPQELNRADYIVSSNVARTVQVCRQAVLDGRRAIAWLAAEGFGPIGILGTSLGSCLALLTTAHEPLIRAQALNHISPYFADVVWRGISTQHVREGFDGHIELERLRALWKPISPRWYLERVHDRRTLLVYARYDLTFPADLSKDLVREFRDRGVPYELAVLRCGHYTSGITPFKFLDGWILMRFLKKALSDLPPQ